MADINKIKVGDRLNLGEVKVIIVDGKRSGVYVETPDGDDRFVHYEWVKAAEHIPDPKLPSGAAVVGHGAIIEPGAVVKDGAVIGSGAIIKSGAIVGYGAIIGSRAIIKSGALVKSGDVIPSHSIVTGSVVRKRH